MTSRTVINNGMRYHEIISESIVDLTQKRDERNLQNFHREFHDDLRDRMLQRAEHIRLAQEDGIFDGFVIGERIRTKNGSVYKITGFDLSPINSPKIADRKRDFFRSQGWGEPTFIKFDDKLYEPVINVENDDEQTRLIVAALRSSGFTPLRGPQRVSEESRRRAGSETITNEKSPAEIEKSIQQVSRNFNLFGGNCAAFAVILNRVLGGDGNYLIVDGGHYEYVDHVALVYRGKVYDGNGLTSHKALRQEWSGDEPVTLDTFHDPSPDGDDVRRLVDSTGGGVFASVDERKLEAALRSALGILVEARIEKDMRKASMRGSSEFVDKEGRVIKLKASPRYEHFPDDPNFVGRVTAYHDGKEIANVDFRVVNPRAGGYLSWKAGRLWVDEPFRRMGLATVIYNFAYRQGFRPLEMSNTLSDEGEKFWSGHLKKKAEAGLTNHWTDNHANRFHWLPLDGTNIGKSWKR